MEASSVPLSSLTSLVLHVAKRQRRAAVYSTGTSERILLGLAHLDPSKSQRGLEGHSTVGARQ